MGMNLYQLNAAFEELMTDIDSGRVDPQQTVTDADTGDTLTLAEALDRLAVDFDTKAENIGLWIKNIAAEITAIKAEEDALYARRKTATRRMESLKSYLGSALQGVRFSTPRVSITFRRSESVEIVNEDLLPKDFLRTKTTVEPDKLVIRDYLKMGRDVPGAMLTTKTTAVVK